MEVGNFDKVRDRVEVGMGVCGTGVWMDREYRASLGGDEKEGTRDERTKRRYV